MKLFEALEKRTDLLGRIRSIDSILQQLDDSDTRLSMLRTESTEKLFVDEVSQMKLSDRREKYEDEYQTLNSAIQRTNYLVRIEFDGKLILLAEALSLRQRLNHRISRLQKRSEAAAIQRIVHTDTRDVAIHPEESFEDVFTDLEKARNLFLEMNTAIRRASQTAEITFDN